MSKDEIEKECVDAQKALHVNYGARVEGVSAAYSGGRINRRMFNELMAAQRQNYLERWDEIEGRYHDRMAMLNDVCRCGHKRMEHGADGICDGADAGDEVCPCEEFTPV